MRIYLRGIFIGVTSCLCMICFIQWYKHSLSPSNASDKKLIVNVFNIDPNKASKKRINKVENKVCNIPNLELLNPEIMKSYKPPKPLNCEKYASNWLFVDENGVLQLTDYARRSFANQTISCQLTKFDRKTDEHISYKFVDAVQPGYKLTNGDFFQIDCSNDLSDHWKHLFMTLTPKEEVIQRARSTTRAASWTGLSVYWFAFDSMSQMAFRRNLPLTVKFLEEQLGAVILNGYNIVGDGTPQAYIPILTGQTELELPLTRKRYKEANYVDVYPFVWNNFTDAGYATLYGEDAGAIGTFTYRLKGFNVTPTDHYTRTFFLKSEKFFPSFHCFGSEKQFTAWQKYGRDFMTKYPKETPKFAVLHHSALSHDDVTLVSVIDEELRDHLKQLFDAGAFDDTVVFVGADHGHRFAAMRETEQGQLEERLPFMAIALPKKFTESARGSKVLRNLKDNAQRLTTPFDIHATFLDILELHDDQLDVEQSTEKRSLSLFRPIPKTRGCDEAGVETHWCTCLSWETAEDGLAKIFAQAVVDVFNRYTEPERKLCAPLQLKTVVSAKKLHLDDQMLKYGGIKDKDGFVPNFNGKANATAETYMLTFITTPGNARYEATVQFDLKRRQLAVDMLAISHVNKFGDAPHCIIDKNYFLATYCVCYDQISWFG